MSRYLVFAKLVWCSTHCAPSRSATWQSLAGRERRVAARDAANRDDRHRSVSYSMLSRHRVEGGAKKKITATQFWARTRFNAYISQCWVLKGKRRKKNSHYDFLSKLHAALIALTEDVFTNTRQLPRAAEQAHAAVSVSEEHELVQVTDKRQNNGMWRLRSHNCRVCTIMAKSTTTNFAAAYLWVTLAELLFGRLATMYNLPSMSTAVSEGQSGQNAWQALGGFAPAASCQPSPHSQDHALAESSGEKAPGDLAENSKVQHTVTLATYGAASTSSSDKAVQSIPSPR
ncbi:hypothetical protein GQ600_5017 [Phytophthora cactorum]|nr:hypothetical protein GQ600_5017 [Phytophthora cactorum]